MNVRETKSKKNMFEAAQSPFAKTIRNVERQLNLVPHLSSTPLSNYASIQSFLQQTSAPSPLHSIAGSLLAGGVQQSLHSQMVEMQRSALSTIQTNSIFKDIGNLGKLQSSVSSTISSVILSFNDRLIANRVSESTHIQNLLSSAVANIGFRRNLISTFENLRRELPAFEGEPSTGEVLLDEIESGISESGLGGADVDTNQAMESWLSWYGKLPTEMKAGVIGLVTMLLNVALTFGLSYLFSPTSNARLPEKTRVRAVQNIVMNVSVDAHYSRGSMSKIRIIAVDQTPIYSRPRRDAHRVGLIDAGRVVLVLENRRKWIRVEWRDDSGSDLQTGWISKRYLKRINGRM